MEKQGGPCDATWHGHRQGTWKPLQSSASCGPPTCFSFQWINVSFSAVTTPWKALYTFYIRVCEYVEPSYPQQKRAPNPPFCFFFLIETFYFVLEDSRLTTLRIVSSGHQSISFSNDICFPHINHKALWGGCYVPTALQPYPGLRRLVIYHKEGNTLFT